MMQNDLKQDIVRNVRRVLTGFCILFCSGCAYENNAKIKDAITQYEIKTNPAWTSVVIDSLAVAPADSTVYFHRILKLLEVQSESYSRMARLRTNLAQADMNEFLAKNNPGEADIERNKLEMEKSMLELKENERRWNSVNDSMDLVLQAVYKTDTLVKPFYQASYTVKALSKNQKISFRGVALLNKENLNILHVDR